MFPRKQFTRRPLRVLLFALVTTGLLSGLVFWIASSGSAARASLRYWDGSSTSYDVIVVGSEPEGIIAAVAAAEEGASVLLVTSDTRLGGLFVTGEMNSLDIITQPELYQRGLFETWWQRVGSGSAFDVTRAEKVFEAMLAEASVEVLLGAASVEPLLDDEHVTGIILPEVRVLAGQVIDATADADFAAAAGAGYSLGFESIGVDARMVDTLVFRIEGVDWPELMHGVRKRPGYAHADEDAAWGSFGGYPARYQAQEPGIRLRGLNLGRQEDGPVLVNALLVGGINPFDAESRADGKARATREAPRIVDYLRLDLPGFANASFGGVAQSLYVRETRHLQALCQLTVDDVLDNVVTELDVVAGGYPLDVHPLSAEDSGFVFGNPEVYGARLCVAVPAVVEGLWVVGRAAGYDPLAASSARVVPFGMALAEAVGVAAVRALALGESPRTFAERREHILALRERLKARGAYLAEVREREPSGPHEHVFWEAYRTLRRKGLALGGYENDPRLDAEMPALGYAYLLGNVAKRFHGNSRLGRRLLDEALELRGQLTADMALALTAQAACDLGRCVPRKWEALRTEELAPAYFSSEGTLTRGEAYALAAAIAELDDNYVADVLH